MAKLEDLISYPSRKDLEKAVAKPKRPRLQPQMICSSDERKENLCKEIRSLEHRERQEQIVPVLFMFGSPYRILDSTEEAKYLELNMRVERMTQKEAKSLLK